MEIIKSLEILRPIVTEAGKIILSYYEKNLGIRHKSPVDLVTDADEASERYLFEKISELFPTAGILAEEGSQKNSQNGYFWVIDPLDGTTSFAHGFPFFAVSVGLIDDRKTPVGGIVYNPFFNEFFWACQNEGAFLNDKKISVSNVSDIRQALIATGFPYNRREIMAEILSRLGKVLHQVHDIRRTGSASLDICYVACGRTDGYYEAGLKPWDTCAAVSILKEAGGMVSRFTGETFNIFIPEIVCSNGKIHQELLNLL